MTWLYVSLAILFVVAVVILPFVREWRRPPVSDAERAGAPGRFLKLSQGITYCRWVGPTRGPVAVVVHGVSTPMIGAEGIAAGLGALGYRVLLYDLYGRGLSDAPKGKQSRAFFVRQLADLCAAHGLTDDLTIAGYSMGGNIATAFATDYPHSVKKVLLVAPAGLGIKESRFMRFCRDTPLVGDWAHAMFGRLVIWWSIPRKSKDPNVTKVYTEQRAQLNRRGYLPAVLSSWRHTLYHTQEESLAQLSVRGISLSAVWAREDEVIPLAASGRLAECYRNARQEMVDGADHGLPYKDVPGLTAAIRAVMVSS